MSIQSTRAEKECSVFSLQWSHCFNFSFSGAELYASHYQSKAPYGGWKGQRNWSLPAHPQVALRGTGPPSPKLVMLSTQNPCVSLKNPEVTHPCRSEETLGHRGAASADARMAELHSRRSHESTKGRSFCKSKTPSGGDNKPPPKRRGASAVAIFVCGRKK